jgi:hypothetical protein
MRFRGFLILIGAVLIALTFTFPLWSPLFENTEVTTEELVVEGLPADLQAVYLALPADQQAIYSGILAQSPENVAVMLRAAIAPPISAPEEMQALPSLTGPVEVGGGEFLRIDAIRWGQGDVTIFQQVDDSKIMRFENFSVANGPDLRVVLSASTAPTTVEMMREGELDIDLGQLAGTTGNQNYTIPADTDLSLYNSVVIYSPTVDMIYSYAPLTMS